MEYFTFILVVYPFIAMAQDHVHDSRELWFAGAQKLPHDAVPWSRPLCVHLKAEEHKEANLPQGAICTSQKSRDVAVAIRDIHILQTISFGSLRCEV